jgi:uncharacterized protein (TIGR02444 family)
MFSEGAYAKQKIKRACIALRDKYKLNSNILLFCCWLAGQNYPELSELDAKNIVLKVSSWHDKITTALRILRKTVTRQYYLKDTFPLLFDLVMDNENFAERIEQSLISQSMYKLKRDYDSMEKCEKRAVKNIFRYVKSQQVCIHKVDLDKVHCIVEQCFG